MLTGVIICSNMKHLIWVPKLRNRVSMQKHRSFLDYNTQALISFALPCKENIKLCFWPYLCFKRHTHLISLYSFSLTKWNWHLVATPWQQQPPRIFAIDFFLARIPCHSFMAEKCEKFQEFFPQQESQPTWKNARLCWYIHANLGSKCKRD